MRILIYSYEIWIYNIIKYISITSITKILSQSNCMSNANITTYLTNLFHWIFTVSRRTLYIYESPCISRFHNSRRNLTCEYNASFVTREWLAPVTRGGTLQRQTSFLTTLRNFLTGPLFRYSTLFVDDTMRPLLSSLLERDVLKLASSLDWRITLFFFGGCDCHEGSKRSKCFRIALEGPPSFVRLLFVLFVDEERVSPFYIRIL